jgi:hypothetical protein
MPMIFLQRNFCPDFQRRVFSVHPKMDCAKDAFTPISFSSSFSTFFSKQLDLRLWKRKPPGSVPPGSMPPGSMPPGRMPPGRMPPGKMPPGNKSSGRGWRKSASSRNSGVFKSTTDLAKEQDSILTKDTNDSRIMKAASGSSTMDLPPSPTDASANCAATCANTYVATTAAASASTSAATSVVTAASPASNSSNCDVTFKESNATRFLPSTHDRKYFAFQNSPPVGAGGGTAGANPPSGATLGVTGASLRHRGAASQSISRSHSHENAAKRNCSTHPPSPHEPFLSVTTHGLLSRLHLLILSLMSLHLTRPFPRASPSSRPARPSLFWSLLGDFHGQADNVRK